MLDHNIKTRVEAIVYDASATNNLDLYVLINAGFSPGATSIPALNSVGSGGLQTLSAIVDPPLENGGQTFFVSVGAFPRWDANLKVLEYRFTYSN